MLFRSLPVESVRLRGFVRSSLFVVIATMRRGGHQRQQISSNVANQVGAGEPNRISSTFISKEFGAAHAEPKHDLRRLVVLGRCSGGRNQWRLIGQCQFDESNQVAAAQRRIDKWCTADQHTSAVFGLFQSQTVE